MTLEEFNEVYTINICRNHNLVGLKHDRFGRIAFAAWIDPVSMEFLRTYQALYNQRGDIGRVIASCDVDHGRLSEKVYVDDYRFFDSGYMSNAQYVQKPDGRLELDSCEVTLPDQRQNHKVIFHRDFGFFIYDGSSTVYEISRVLSETAILIPHDVVGPSAVELPKEIKLNELFKLE